MNKTLWVAFAVAGCTNPDVSPTVAIDLETPTPLTDLAVEAVALAPLWLQHDLALSFQRVEDTLQDDLAQVMVDESDPYLVDEIGFVIAHLSPQVLESKRFFPQLLTENAQLVYARDADLDYVQLEDVGEPGVDADYYTTATYRVQTEDGTIETRTIEREIYYWYVVHPRLEDELPYYIDPWFRCRKDSLECPSNPDTGSLWRSFLWDGARDDCEGADSCPVISDYVAGQELLWKSRAYDAEDNGAIGDVINFLQEELVFGAENERSIQPNRIYGLGRGNCGEWADMTSALARTVLIPSHNVGAWANDHTWNEFWDDGWNQWEPVNTHVLHYGYYLDAEGNSGGTPVYAVSATRGDSMVWGRSDPYAVTFDLELTVQDADGVPVDGATVVLYGPITVYPEYEGQWWYITEAVTDIEGVARLTLGEKNQYAVRVISPLGTYPVEENTIAPIIDASVAGRLEQITLPALEGSMPAPLALAAEASVKEPDMTARIELQVDGFRLEGNSARGHSFSEPKSAGTLDRFVVSEADYEKFLAGESFEAIDHAFRAGSETVEVDLKRDTSTYVVLANRETLATAAVGWITVSVEESTLETPYRLRAGEHLAIRIGD